MNKAQLKQLFRNKTDCYAETTDSSVIPAMTEERFLEVVAPLLNIEEQCTDPESFDHVVQGLNGKVYYPLTPSQCIPPVTGDRDMEFEKTLRG